MNQLYNNKEIMLIAIKDDSKMIDYLGNDLKKDKDVMMVAVK